MRKVSPKYTAEPALLKLSGIDPDRPPLPPAPRNGPAYKLVFNNRRELWQAKRAAKALNLNFNSYCRSLIDAQARAVLAWVERKEAKAKRLTNGKSNGSTTSSTVSNATV